MRTVRIVEAQFKQRYQVLLNLVTGRLVGHPGQTSNRPRAVTGDHLTGRQMPSSRVGLLQQGEHGFRVRLVVQVDVVIVGEGKTAA